MIDTINDGTLYLRGPVRIARYRCVSIYFARKGRLQISRYAADHGVAFPDLLNTEADEGQLQHTKLCLLSLT